jgi:hypothetical protein
MKLECKRNRTKERALLKNNSASSFLGMLNKHNIQHFTYDTNNCKLFFTQGNHPQVINLSLSRGVYPAVDIADVCTIVNMNSAISNLIKDQRASQPSFDQWLLEKAGFKYRSHAELSMQQELKQKENIQNQIKELTKKLESYV